MLMLPLPASRSPGLWALFASANQEYKHRREVASQVGGWAGGRRVGGRTGDSKQAPGKGPTYVRDVYGYGRMPRVLWKPSAYDSVGPCVAQWDLELEVRDMHACT